MQNYKSISEAALILGITKTEVFALAKIKKIRFCIAYKGRIELSIYDQGAYPPLMPIISNKLFNGYLLVPSCRIKQSKEIQLSWADIFETLDAGNDEDKWMIPTDKAPRIAARRMCDSSLERGENGYLPFNINPIYFLIPKQDVERRLINKESLL